MGTQVDRAMILEVVAMETATFEVTATEPVAEPATATSPGPETTIAPEPSMEAWVDLQPEASTEVVVCEVMTKDEAPLRSAPMPEIGTSSRGCLEFWTMS
jgi:hypothetical protein